MAKRYQKIAAAGRHMAPLLLGNLALLSARSGLEDSAALNGLCLMNLAARHCASREARDEPDAFRRAVIAFTTSVLLACYIVKILIDGFLSGPQQLVATP